MLLLYCTICWLLAEHNRTIRVLIYVVTHTVLSLINTHHYSLLISYATRPFLLLNSSLSALSPWRWCRWERPQRACCASSKSVPASRSCWFYSSSRGWNWSPKKKMCKCEEGIQKSVVGELNNGKRRSRDCNTWSPRRPLRPYGLVPRWCGSWTAAPEWEWLSPDLWRWSSHLHAET